MSKPTDRNMSLLPAWMAKRVRRHMKDTDCQALDFRKKCFSKFLMCDTCGQEM